MQNSKESKSQKITDLLIEVLSLIKNEVEDNPFIDIEKSLKIVVQRNFNQYPSVKKKIGNAIMMIYGQRFINKNLIIKKLDEVYILLTESPQI